MRRAKGGARAGSSNKPRRQRGRGCKSRNLTAARDSPTSRRNRAFPPERHSGYRTCMADPYSTLGVAKSASEAEIKSAYRKLAQKLNPDRNKANPKAAEIFSDLARSKEERRVGKEGVI